MHPCYLLFYYDLKVLDMLAYETRQREYASRGQKHFYFMTLNGSEVHTMLYYVFHLFMQFHVNGVDYSNSIVMWKIGWLSKTSVRLDSCLYDLNLLLPYETVEINCYSGNKILADFSWGLNFFFSLLSFFLSFFLSFMIIILTMMLKCVF